MKFGIVICFCLVVLAGCSRNTSVTGQPEQWIRAKNFSVRVSFTEDKLGKIGIRNDSSQDARLLPLTIRAWYKHYGEKEETMRSGEVEILKPGQQLEMSIPPFLLMDSSVPAGIPPTDKPYKLQVELGPDRSKEIFTVGR